jgi:GAF domain-containing protein
MRRETWRPFRRAKPAAPERRGAKDSRASASGVLLADVHGHPNGMHSEFTTDWHDLTGVEVVAGEFVATTADLSNQSEHEPISRLLRQVREKLGMDVVFVSQFVHGERLIRHAASAPGDTHSPAEGEADPLEATYCQRVLEGRLPAAMPDARRHPEAARLPLTRALDVRAHVAAPIVTRDGRIYGTVCAFAHRSRSNLEESLALLRHIARMLASALERADAR